MTPTPHLSIVGLGHQGELKREGSVDPSRGSAQDQDSQLNSNGLDIQKTGYFAEEKGSPWWQLLPAFKEMWK